MADLLLELFSEEIPARMQEVAAEYFGKALKDALTASRLEHKTLVSFVTPRRLAFLATGLPDTQPDISIEKKGPKVGAPEAALQGFLKSTGMALEQLEQRDLGKETCYFAVMHQKGQPTQDALKTIIEKILKDFVWPKSMRWGAHDISWVRPLHNILCLLGDKVVPVQFGPCTANNKTFGHRFLAPQAIEVKQAGDYEALLEKAYVIADREKRRALIAQKLQETAQGKKLTLKQDEGLLEEVTGLVEWPTVLTGGIDAHYMTLPPEVLVSEMRAHQKYFALVETHEVTIEAGRDVEKNIVPHLHAGTAPHLAPYFLMVSNMVTGDGGKAIVAGNERVLRARLADGRFFWEQDRKKTLDAWAEGLVQVTFHAKLGTLAEKIGRMKILAALLCDSIKTADEKKLQRAVELCKADLLTGMVGEFPDLQGVMGRYYALAQGEDAIVANAIRDHYLPLGPNTPCPAEPLAVCVALADKLDTLIGMFNAGEKPTGSKDPFALRRAALGVIRLILENNIRLPLKTILPSSRGPQSGSTGSHASQDPAQTLRVSQDDGSHGLLEFLSDRLQVSLKDKGIRHDVVKAVLANGDDDLVRVVNRARALQEFLSTEDGANLLAGYKRAANIVAIEEKKDKVTYAGETDANLLAVAEEKELAATLKTILPSVTHAILGEKFEESMTALAKLRPPVDAFFDKVTVNAEDKAQRANRLHILSQIRSVMDKVADFSLIEG